MINLFPTISEIFFCLIKSSLRTLSPRKTRRIFLANVNKHCIFIYIFLIFSWAYFYSLLERSGPLSSRYRVLAYLVFYNNGRHWTLTFRRSRQRFIFRRESHFFTYSTLSLSRWLWVPCWDAAISVVIDTEAHYCIMSIVPRRIFAFKVFTIATFFARIWIQ